jgi:hypothetical protein
MKPSGFLFETDQVKQKQKQKGKYGLPSTGAALSLSTWRRV